MFQATIQTVMHTISSVSRCHISLKHYALRSVVLQSWLRCGSVLFFIPTIAGGEEKSTMNSNGHFKATANTWYVKLRTDIQFDTGRKVGDCGRPQACQWLCKY